MPLAASSCCPLPRPCTGHLRLSRGKGTFSFPAALGKFRHINKQMNHSQTVTEGDSKMFYLFNKLISPREVSSHLRYHRDQSCAQRYTNNDSNLKNNKHSSWLWSTYSLPSTALCTLSLVLIIILRCGYCDHHLTDKETEAREIKELSRSDTFDNYLAVLLRNLSFIQAYTLGGGTWCLWLLWWF